MPRKVMVRDLLADCIVTGSFYDIYSDYGNFVSYYLIRFFNENRTFLNKVMNQYILY